MCPNWFRAPAAAGYPQQLAVSGERLRPRQGRASGNQREKLCMTTAAMSVLPRPVGRQTSVLLSSAVRMMDSWYARSLTPAGYTHVLAANLRGACAMGSACALGPVRCWPCGCTQYAVEPGSGNAILLSYVSELFAWSSRAHAQAPGLQTRMSRVCRPVRRALLQHCSNTQITSSCPAATPDRRAPAGEAGAGCARGAPVHADAGRGGRALHERPRRAAPRLPRLRLALALRLRPSAPRGPPGAGVRGPSARRLAGLVTGQVNHAVAGCKRIASVCDRAGGRRVCWALLGAPCGRAGPVRRRYGAVRAAALQQVGLPRGPGRPGRACEPRRRPGAARPPGVATRQRPRGRGP